MKHPFSIYPYQQRSVQGMVGAQCLGVFHRDAVFAIQVLPPGASNVADEPAAPWIAEAVGAQRRSVVAEDDGQVDGGGFWCLTWCVMQNGTRPTHGKDIAAGTAPHP